MFRTIKDRAPNAAISAAQRQDRSTDELLGICRGLLADGAVNVLEANYLTDWLHRHAEFADVFPFRALLERLHDALADGVLDTDEERDLLDALSRTVGGEAEGGNGSRSLSTALPVNDGVEIRFSGALFVVTGTFAYGPRRTVVEAIETRGGHVKPDVTKEIDFLVMGEVGSRDWKHSSFGRKIEKAVSYRDQGAAIAIVSEAQWRDALA